MSQLETVYKRLQESKARRREIGKMLRDELSHNQRFQEIQEEMKTLREEKKAIENEMKSMSLNVADELDELKIDIQSDEELLADIALNMYVSSESVEIVDEYDNRWVPSFKVSFKKD